MRFAISLAMYKNLMHYGDTVTSTAAGAVWKAQNIFMRRNRIMFQFKGGRLYPDVLPRTLSFEIPTGFRINTFPEGNSQDHIAFATADKVAEVEVSVENSQGRSTKEDVFRYFDDAPADEVDGSYPISVDELNGHCIYCLGACRSQYVVSLDIGSCGFICGYGPTGNAAEPIDRLEVTVTIDRKEDNKDAEQAIKAVAADPGFVSLLESIRIE